MAVLSAYRFHMFELAAQLERRCDLYRLLTAMPRRLIDEQLRARARTRPSLAVARLTLERLAHRRVHLANRAVIRDFDAFCSRNLGEPRFVHALSGFATHTLAAASARGLVTVCDRGSWHILEQKAVLDAAADQWGWPPEHFDPWLVDREIQEYEAATAIFVPSEPAVRSFVRRGCTVERLRKVPYGVDTTAFFPAPVAERDLQQAVCVGPVGLQKGHPALLEAYRSVRRPGSSLRLIGPCYDDARRRLRLPEDDVVVEGVISRMEVADRMRRAGFFVLASVQEGLAMVVLQAMASGLPVVATRATGAEEMIVHGVNGFLVADGDTSSLKASIAALLDAPERVIEMGSAARETALSLGAARLYGDRAIAALRSLVGTSNDDVPGGEP